VSPSSVPKSNPSKQELCLLRTPCRLLSLILDTDDGSITLLGNVTESLFPFMIFWLLVRLLDREDGGNTLLRNVSESLCFLLMSRFLA
jgi:hypothetical protein